MLLHMSVGDAVEAAVIIADRTHKDLSQTAKKLYTALVGAGVEVMKERGYSSAVTEVAYFCPAESVALAIGVHPSTVYRKLPELREHGLVECRGHYCTHNGVTRSDGTVWSVRLTPTWGSKARVPFDYLKRSYRCLGADIDQGRTAFAQMRESYPTRDKLEIRLHHILRWALSTPNKPSVTLTHAKPQRFDLESIFDVPAVEKQERPDMVYNAARALAGSLNDNDSTRFYCALLWGLLRLKDRGAGDYFAALHLMACRARADMQEGFSRKGGAVLTARLKQANWYEDLKRSSRDKIKA